MGIAKVKLKNFYVMPVCSPTRAALMSGRHPIRYGAQTGVASGPAGARNWACFSARVKLYNC